MTKKQRERIVELSEILAELETQDNMATGEPIYFVQERITTYNCDPESGLDYIWIETESGDCVEATKIERIGLNVCDANMEVPEGWRKTYYDERWENVQPFFTRVGAERFVVNQAHHHGELRVYVGSANYNPEWKAVRRAILEGLFSEEGAPVETSTEESADKT